MTIHKDLILSPEEHTDRLVVATEMKGNAQEAAISDLQDSHAELHSFYTQVCGMFRATENVDANDIPAIAIRDGAAIQGVVFRGGFRVIGNWRGEFGFHRWEDVQSYISQSDLTTLATLCAELK